MKKKLLVTLAVVLVLGGFAVGQGRAEETNNLTADPSGYTEMSWPDTDMAHSVPTPVSSTGSMYATEKTVVADVANTSEDSYNAYVEKCKKEELAKTPAYTFFCYIDAMYAADNGVCTLVLSMADDNVMNISMNVVE